MIASFLVGVVVSPILGKKECTKFKALQFFLYIPKESLLK